MKYFKIILILFFFQGCGEKINSDKVSSDSIYFTMVIQNQNLDTVECYTRASVQSEFGNSVEFAKDDYLKCNGVTMNKKTDFFGNYIFYTATVPVNSDRRYFIKYFKQNVEYSSSEIQTPGLLKMNFPNPGFVIDANQVNAVLWNGENNERTSVKASITLVADKETNNKEVFSLSGETNDSGNLVLGSFNKKYPQLQITKKSDVVLNLRRLKKGKVDPRIRGHFDSVETANVNGYLLEN